MAKTVHGIASPATNSAIIAFLALYLVLPKYLNALYSVAESPP